MTVAPFLLLADLIWTNACTKIRPSKLKKNQNQNEIDRETERESER